MKQVMAKKKVSKVGKMFQVRNGTRERTAGGLRKSDLMKNKNGKVVSKKKSSNTKKSKASSWIAAVAKARKMLGIKGFCACGGKSAQGKALLARARSLYKA